MRKVNEKQTSFIGKVISRLYLWYSFETTYMLGQTESTPFGLLIFHSWSLLLILFMVIFPSFVRVCWHDFMIISLTSWMIFSFVPAIVFRIYQPLHKKMNIFLSYAGQTFIDRIEVLKSKTHPICVIMICISHIGTKIVLFLLSFFVALGMI